MNRIKKIFVGHEINDLSRNKKILWIFATIVMITCVSCLEFYLDRTLEAQTNSDISSELILANQLSKESSILSENWYYSTEIRFFNTNLVFMPLFRLFKNWHVIRLFGTIILHICLLLTTYCLCRVTRITVLFPAIGFILLMPFSGQYYNCVLQFPYYIPHIVISLLIFTLTYKSTEKTSNRFQNIVLTIVSGVISILAGMGGARQIIVCFIPLFLSALIPYIAVKRKQMGLLANHEKWGQYLISSIVCLLGASVGFLINVTILSGKYHYLIYDISFSSFDANRIFLAIGGIFNSFGYISGKIDGQIILRNIMAGGIFIASLYLAVCGIRRGWRNPDAYFFLSSFYIASLTIFLLLYGFTDMIYVDRYNLPFIVLAIPLIGLGLKSLQEFSYRFKITILILLSMLIGFSSYKVLSDYNTNKSDHQIIADYLVDNNYNTGYATFWNANILTELSNGKIDVYHWDISLEKADGDVDRTFKWLQLVKHDIEHPEGKVFLLFENNQIKPNMDPNTVASQKLWKLNDSRIIFVQGDYSVYGYESYNDMVSDIYDYDFVFQDGSWLRNGEDLQGVRILQESGISYGPYIEFREGRYRVTVRGNGLSRADFLCTYDCGENNIGIEMISVEDQEAIYEFVVTERVANGETIIRNPSAEKIEIYGEQIDYLGPIANKKCFSK